MFILISGYTSTCAISTLVPPAVKQIKREWKVQPDNIDNSDRIVVGSNAYAGDILYVASVRQYIGGYCTHICGGTIIRYDRVLTTAHRTFGVS
ncbi:hypothetical protein TrispH2_002852 [Trichoplax sp. H2]|nr:hypothetical protein TrispH2_002852 [Trichoplax sp. H2]|eukprot:RDD44811.1 hypothetical protein TrispH2_002852 [Trichoplax sp. H2]